MDADLVRKHAIALNSKRIRLTQRKIPRCVLLTEVFNIYPDDQSLANELGLSVGQVRSVIDYEAGVLYDPWASVVKINNIEEITLYDATVKGLIPYR